MIYIFNIMAEESRVFLKHLFWIEQPYVLFAEAEVLFNIRKIMADETKAYYIISALDQGTATYLLDIINQPSCEDMCKELKGRILDSFGLSQRVCASRLLHIWPISQFNHSALLDEMLVTLHLTYNRTVIPRVAV